MLNNKLIDYFKSQSWWYDNTTEEYKNALEQYSIDLESDFAHFYLHVEDSTTFLSDKFELLQLCWFIQNTDYSLLVTTTQKVFGLNEAWLPITNLEAESCAVYNKNTQEVIFLETGMSINDAKLKFKTWNEFLLWYFDL